MAKAIRSISADSRIRAQAGRVTEKQLVRLQLRTFGGKGMQERWWFQAHNRRKKKETLLLPESRCPDRSVTGG